MRKMISSKFAGRLASSMLAVLILPVCILFFIYSQFIAKNVAAEIHTIIQNELSASMRLLDRTLVNYQEKAMFLKQSEGMESYLMHQRFITDRNGAISSELLVRDVTSAYKLSHNADCLFIYFPYSESVISAGTGYGLATSEVFFSRYFTDSTGLDLPAYISRQQSFSILSTATINVTGMTPSGKQTISLIYPIHSSVDAYVVFCIQPEYLSQHFNFQTHNMGLTTLVFNQNGEYVFSNGQEDPALLVETVAQTSLVSNNAAEGSVHYDGKEYLAVQTISSVSGWRGITLIPLDSPIYSTLFDADKYFLIILLLTMISGGILVYFLVYVNYKPVKVLRNRAADIAVGISNDTPHDDISMISGTLMQLHEQHATLSETFSSNLSAIQRVRLHYLLNDYYASLEEFNADCEQIGLCFHFPYFFVSTFLIPEDKRASMDMIAELVSGELCKVIDSKYVFSIKRDQLVFLHNVPAPEAAANLEPFFSALGLLNDNFSFSSAVGIGRVYHGTPNISKSLIQAVNAFEFRFMKGTGAVVLYDEINELFDRDHPYPSQQIQQLRNETASGNMEAARDCVNTLMAYIYQHELPTYLSRSICSDIVKALLSWDSTEIDTSTSLSETLIRLSRVKSYANFKAIIDGVCMTCMAETSSRAVDEEKQLLDNILSYIGENYHRGDFSIQEVALHFSKSPSYISIFFKEKMNCTVLDYLINLRMHTAKVLLRTTQLSLQEICERVGYYNVSSFSRRFKASEGLTPNSYRFQEQKNPNVDA